MTPGVLNITVKRGSKLSKQWNWKDQIGTTVVLTGYSAAMVVRARADSQKKLLSLSSEGASPAITLGGTPYNIVVSVSEATMQAIPAGTYVWDLELKDSLGGTYPLLTGSFTVTGSAVHT